MKKFLIGICALIASLSFLRYYLGGFASYQVEEKEMGPYTLIYVTHTGDYKKVGSVMNEIYETLLSGGVIQTAGMGIYIDNPETVAADQLRSEVGSVIDSKDTEKALALNTGYQVKTLVKSTKLVVAFPYKNMLSYFVGPMKIYPIFQKYMTEKGYEMNKPAIELYDQTNKTIYFMVEK